MSDFDKEAEREKLREKYEQDQQKRAATEQMSELLLQGATMTNAHCSTCGDPIFRYDGQEFCPTCEKAVERDGADEDGDQGSIEVTETSETSVAFGGAPDEQQEGGTEPREAGDATQTETPGEQQPARGQARQSDGQHDQRRTQSGEQPRQRAPAQRGDGTRPPRGSRDPPRRDQPSDAGSGIPAARDALVETLVRFSERAAATDDPRRARDSLEAAREAAAALSELDR